VLLVLLVRWDPRVLLEYKESKALLELEDKVIGVPKVRREKEDNKVNVVQQAQDRQVV
jgi:hypothetical protein